MNAQRSTGPRTPQGKSSSSRNALRHGLTAANPVVLDEDPGEFEAFAREMCCDLRPRTATQALLVDRIIFVSWKLRRIPEIEATVIQEYGRDFVSSFRDLPRETLTAAQVIGHEACQAYFGRLQMYEMRLERSLHASLRQLAKLKEEQQEDEPQEEAPEPDESTGVDHEGSQPQDASVQNEATAKPGSSQVVYIANVADTVAPSILVKETNGVATGDAGAAGEFPAEPVPARAANKLAG